MPTYYVGPGGNDGNSGLTWALRKLTLNGVEDIPVAAGDIVYVGPGVYRELLTVDVDGGAGNEITYIADKTGGYTDGVGGIIRITGSDNDQTIARASWISADSKDYRIFRGFHFDLCSSHGINAINSCTNWTIEDCTFGEQQSSGTVYAIHVEDSAQANFTIRRCWFGFAHPYRRCVMFIHTGTVDDTGHVVENCVFNESGRAIQSDRVGGITVRNCLFTAQADGVRVGQNLSVGQTVTVNNCVFTGCQTAVRSSALGYLVEDYNTFFGNSTDRNNVNVGGNSVAYPMLPALPFLYSGASQISGFRFPWCFGQLSEWSQIRHLAGTGEPDEDLWGIARPIDNSKCSWGPCQFQDIERDTLVTRGASEASLVIHEPSRMQMWVPVSNVQTTISTYVYRLAGYSSVTNPQMIIKQPGQADRVTTDAAAASQWNLLSDTFTPAADPPYVIVELVSHEGATSTSTSITSTSTTVTSTSTSITSTSTSTTSTSTSTTSTSLSTSTTTLAYNVYFDDMGVN